MKSNELNKKVLKKLHEFESIENIYPSLDWEAKLKTKIQFNSSIKNTFISKYSLTLGCVVLLNFGLLVFSIYNESKKSKTRTTNLELISNELLITSNN